MNRTYAEFRKSLGFNTRIFRMVYVLYVAVPLVMGFTAYYLSVRLLGEENALLQREALQAAAARIENTFLQANLLARQVSLRYSVLLVGQFEQPLSLRDRYYISLAVDDLRPYQTSLDRFISDFYVYYPDIDTVITAEAAYDADFFFGRVYSFADFPDLRSVRRYHLGHGRGGSPRSFAFGNGTPSINGSSSRPTPADGHQRRGDSGHSDQSGRRPQRTRRPEGRGGALPARVRRPGPTGRG